jgi:2-dehydro-3-deoxyphosphogluconate aldolase / (4S)-4-hydroxy-2-oxoglutarate aldolase
MARFTRIDVFLKMKEAGIVYCFYDKDPEILRNVIKSLADGGIKVIEFMNRGDYAHELFSEINKWAEQELPQLVIGAGTIVDAETASIYIQLGANFIVSPILNPEMAKVCNRRKIPWLPGCGSISEINYAEELGAEIVKVFPAISIGGPDFIKSVKGPCPWSSIMPTGEIEPTVNNLREWYGAGVPCIGIGASLIEKELIQKRDWKGFTKVIEETTNAVRLLHTV